MSPNHNTSEILKNEDLFHKNSGEHFSKPKKPKPLSPYLPLCGYPTIQGEIIGKKANGCNAIYLTMLPNNKR